MLVEAFSIVMSSPLWSVRRTPGKSAEPDFEYREPIFCIAEALTPVSSVMELIALTASLTSSLEMSKVGVSVPFIVNLMISGDALEDRKTASVIADASTPVSSLSREIRDARSLADSCAMASNVFDPKYPLIVTSSFVVTGLAAGDVAAEQCHCYSHPPPRITAPKTEEEEGAIKAYEEETEVTCSW